MAKSDRTEDLRQSGEDAYFAAANSAQGFRSWYSEIFDDKRITRLYAIKGGPGTGKSCFLREVARAGRAVGRHAEMIRCSSDPDSLDGVILTREGEDGIALLDATAPHVYEPTHPGYREELIDLGQFWDTERLRNDGERIRHLAEEKSAAYRRAYRCLEGYGALMKNAEELVTPCLREAAIARCAARLMREIPNGNGFSPRTALMRGVGMRGSVLLDTFYASAERIVLIEDLHGSAYALMRELYRLCAEKRLSVRVSRDPLLPERTDALFLTDCKLLFAAMPEETCRYPHKSVSMRRMTDAAALRRVRVSLGYAERTARVLLTGATDELSRASDLHFQAEALYSAAMDFPAKERFTKAFCDRLFGQAEARS